MSRPMGDLPSLSERSELREGRFPNPDNFNQSEEDNHMGTQRTSMKDIREDLAALTAVVGTLASAIAQTQDVEHVTLETPAVAPAPEPKAQAPSVFTPTKDEARKLERYKTVIWPAYASKIGERVIGYVFTNKSGARQFWGAPESRYAADVAKKGDSFIGNVHVAEPR